MVITKIPTLSAAFPDVFVSRSYCTHLSSLAMLISAKPTAIRRENHLATVERRTQWKIHNNYKS